MSYPPPASSGNLFSRWIVQWRHRQTRRRDADNRITRGVAQLRAEQASRAGMQRTFAALQQIEQEQAGRPPVLRPRLRLRERLFNRKALLFCGGLLGAVVCAGNLWWVSLNVNPEVASAPPRPAITPNSYALYRQAAQNVQSDALISLAINPPKKTDDSQRKVYLLSREEKKALLVENANALRLLRQGFALPYWNERQRASFNQWDSVEPKYRALARLLILESRFNAEADDWNGAMQSALDAMYLGVELPRGGPLMSSLVGSACEAIGQAELVKIYPKLTTAQLRRLLQRLEELETKRTSLAETLREEREFMRTALMDAFRDPNWRFTLLRDAGTWENNNLGRANAFGVPLSLMTISKRRIMENALRTMDEGVAAAEKPYSKTRKIEPGDPITAVVVGAIGHRDFGAALAQTRNGILRLTLALELYRRENSRYPERLEALVPNCLNALPTDRFAQDAPFQYRRTSAGYLLYSLGPDAMDDGGKPMVNQTGENRRLVGEESQGDIVAGVNAP